jgi:hypothetical protein
MSNDLNKAVRKTDAEYRDHLRGAHGYQSAGSISDAGLEDAAVRFGVVAADACRTCFEYGYMVGVISNESAWVLGEPARTNHATVVLANECNYSHPFDGRRGQVRILPIGGGANVFLCFDHYVQEMQFRRERIAAGVPFDLPEWETLRVYSEEPTP